MGVRWIPLGFCLPFCSFFILILQTSDCGALNPEGSTLLEFRAGVYYDPRGVFANWNSNDSGPCRWLGVYCEDGVVEILNLSGFSLEGILTPVLGKLLHLRCLVLSKNRFFGDIPREIGGLPQLELLDLRDNNLSGRIPSEIGRIHSLKRLFLCGNMFEGSIPEEIKRLRYLSILQFDENLISSLGKPPEGKTFGQCIWQSGFKPLRKPNSFGFPMIVALLRFRFGKYLHDSNKSNCCDYTIGYVESIMVQNEPMKMMIPLRRKLEEESSNLAAIPLDSKSLPQILTTVVTQGSGSFPAVPGANKTLVPPPPPPPPSDSTDPSAPRTDEVPDGGYDYTTADDVNTWQYLLILIPSITVFLFTATTIFLCCRRDGPPASIGPWKTGLSGQLQKALVTGVAKLNRAELETACEDFSNIISTLDGSIVYKGTLSSGVEIAVCSTSVSSLKDWSSHAKKGYKNKIDTLSRVNHKNFVNLLGYCVEDEPFTRMMVFEYAPNGTLFEHLHVKEAEHLDWSTRVRIIMGVAYCLQYMHHDINPHVAHTNINSTTIMLTEDYAAKVAEIKIWSGDSAESVTGKDINKSKNLEVPPSSDRETNVYEFGLLLLEIVTGKIPSAEEKDSLLGLVAQYLDDHKCITNLIDPTLKSFKNTELDMICEVIQGCTRSNIKQRYSMQKAIKRLKEVINISPEQATPSLSPLWWAELEILSAEAT